MYRNIIGHSVYQLTVLVFLIFYATSNNWLVYDYNTPCLSYDGDVCKVFNPYFTTELYYTQVEIDQWTERYTEGTFNQNLLRRFGPPPNFDDPTEKLLHYTIIFNAFVFL